MKRLCIFLLVLLLSASRSGAVSIDDDEFGAVEGVPTLQAALRNTKALKVSGRNATSRHFLPRNMLRENVTRPLINHGIKFNYSSI